MLIGAHVSTAGGLRKAHERGVESDSEAIQIFNQSPRMWRPVTYGDEDVEGFRALMAAGPVEVVVIHAVYLINCAAKEPEIREKSVTSLIHALRVGDAIGARGVVLHPGSQKKQEREERKREKQEAKKAEREAKREAQKEHDEAMRENTAELKATREWGERMAAVEEGTLRRALADVLSGEIAGAGFRPRAASAGSGSVARY